LPGRPRCTKCWHCPAEAHPLHRQTPSSKLPYTTGGISDWDKLMAGVFSNLPMKQEGQILVNLGVIHKDYEWSTYFVGWISWMREQGYRFFSTYIVSERKPYFLYESTR
jgi:hypothetical protein